MSNEIVRCPRCENILAMRKGILYCAHCEKLLKTYCKQHNIEYSVARRLLADTGDHVSWRWKNSYGWDIVIMNGENLSKKFQKVIGI